MIELVNVIKTINGSTIFNNISLFISKGSRIYIIGPSGSGKTQFLYLCSRITKPDSGKIIISGYDTAEMSTNQIRKIRQNMPLIIQSSALVESLSVYNNIAFPLKHIQKKSPLEIQKIVGKIVEELNIPIHILQCKPSELSPGILKYVCIARALILDPSVILLDEPCTGLSHSAKSKIYKKLYMLNTQAGITTLISSHDAYAALKYSSHIIFIEKGNIIYSGVPEGIFDTENESIYNYFRLNKDAQETF